MTPSGVARNGMLSGRNRLLSPLAAPSTYRSRSAFAVHPAHYAPRICFDASSENHFLATQTDPGAFADRSRKSVSRAAKEEARRRENARLAECDRVVKAQKRPPRRQPGARCSRAYRGKASSHFPLPATLSSSSSSYLADTELPRSARGEAQRYCASY